MHIVFLRKRRLGKGSTNGIKATLRSKATTIRHFFPKDWKLWPADDVLLVRWGCTAALDGRKPKLALNTTEAIHWAADKRLSRLTLQAAGVPVPQTWSSDEFVVALREGVGRDGSKFVARPARHAQGRNLRSGLTENLAVFPGGYVSRLIDKVAEYRCFVINGRVAWMARKTPGNPDQVAWNVAQGGRFDNVRWDEWPNKVCQAALDAMAASPLQFGGVDIMVDAAGTAYVLEINSAPSQTSPYRQSCVAKALDYIAEAGEYKAFEPVVWNPRKTYKSYIHPAIREGAANAAA